MAVTIISVVLFISGLADASASVLKCYSQFSKDYDSPSGHALAVFSNTYAPTTQRCCEKCQANPDCTQWSFTNGGCFLKTVGDTPAYNTATIGGKRAGAVQDGAVVHLDSFNSDGSHAIIRFKHSATWEECYEMCENTDGCIAIVYRPSAPYQCTLRNETTSVSFHAGGNTVAWKSACGEFKKLDGHRIDVAYEPVITFSNFTSAQSCAEQCLKTQYCVIAEYQISTGDCRLGKSKLDDTPAAFSVYSGVDVETFQIS